MFKKLFKFNLPLYLVILLVAGAFAGGKYIFSPAKIVTDPTLTKGNNCPVSMEQIRLKDYELTHPLVLTDITEESDALRGIQGKISEYINQAKSEQKADDISVYFRKLDNGAWFSINPNANYNPASMVKVVYLIAYMKMAEINPAILNQKVFFAKHYSEGNNQNIVDFQLKEGVDYPIKDLLIAMITHSDNDATVLLSQKMNMKIYEDVYKDLDIPLPNPVTEYYISATDFSKFFRVLYNSTYCRPEFSEFAIKLLTTSTYKDGLKKGLDDKTIIAHKFGERIIGNKAQLHEFGIVFYQNSPYLIGVMTMGNSLTQLSQIVGDISKIANQNYKLMVNS